MTRLWIISDIHLESSDWDLPLPSMRPAFDVLICVGDLHVRFERTVVWLVSRVDDRPRRGRRGKP
ncbi:putative phosphodiesterase [Nitrobacter winogradskyi]|uniref:Phosphodiesterase n=1 Tax=Nitrobacter winogradskyi TaxID=913 RepID=A0ACC6AR79_NITWI|nr:hypothetical protein [Nitrobacter winogradskyi]MCP2001405.1 putative phosphodiesterase [Nitrobacter winogradskyi]